MWAKAERRGTEGPVVDAVRAKGRRRGGKKEEVGAGLTGSVRGAERGTLDLQDQEFKPRVGA